VPHNPRDDGTVTAAQRPGFADADAAEFLAAHLAPRSTADGVSLLGAGAEDDAALDEGRAFLRALAPRGYAVPSWPAEYGGMGADPATAGRVADLLARHDTPDLYPFLVGLALVGPTLLAHGTREQCAGWLPPIARGEEIWCQLFSEPGAGSDLAGLAARAERDGELWRVSGQKVWSSRAHYAQWGLLLTRTDPDLPKHAGITAFGLDMRTAGVDVRPLRQMNGDAHFNEVFLDGAVVRDEDRIGDIGEGWAVALTTLAHERGALGGGGGLGGAEVLAMFGERGAGSRAVHRQDAADAFARMQAGRWTAARARAGGDERAGAGAKIRYADVLRRVAGLAVALDGPGGVAGPPDDWTTVFVTAPSVSIRGGTDEIQRTVIADRVLRLPPEPRVDKGIPFRDVPRS